MISEIKVSFFLAMKSLFRSNFRTTFLTIIVMSIVVINLIFTPSVIEGLADTFVQSSVNYVIGDVSIDPLKDKEYITNSGSIVKKIKSLPGVSGVSARYVAGGTLIQGEDSVAGSIVGIDPEDERQVTLFHEKMISGDFISEEDTNEVVIGLTVLAGEEGEESAIESLGGAQVGERVSISYKNGVVREYKIKGIYTGGSFLSDSYALISKKEMESVLGITDSASTIIIKKEKGISEDELKNQLYSLGIKEDILTSKEKSEVFVGDITSSFAILSVMSIFVSLAIAIILLFMIIYINTVNKRRQIGVLKAIGIPQNVIVLSYLIQSLAYTFFAIFFGGIALYLIVGYLTSNPIPFPPGPLIPIVRTGLIVQSILSLVITSLVAGILPSWGVSRKNIIDSIWGKE